MTKTFLFCALALLFGHNFIPHHHQGEIELLAYHDANNNADAGHPHLPQHIIDELYSVNDQTVNLSKICVHHVSLIAELPIVIVRSSLVSDCNWLFLNIRPPVIHQSDYFFFRGPPAC